jgi:hypothetical protein
MNHKIIVEDDLQWKMTLRVQIYSTMVCKKSMKINVTSQDFIKFWGKIFTFVLLEMIGNSQGFKTFDSI